MNNLNSIFKKITEIDPSSGLEKRIFKRIALEKRRRVGRKLSFIYSGFATALASLIWIIKTFSSTILQSDFWTLAKLLFSDTGLVLKNWGDFAYSLLETLPIFGIVAVLIPILALFILASEYFKIVNNNRYKFI